MRIHLTGAVSLNGGDAAITAGEVEIFRRQWPEARLTIGDTHWEVAPHYLPEYTFGPMITPHVVTRDNGGRFGTGRRALRRRHLDLVVRATAANRAVGRALMTGPEKRALGPVAAADVVAYTGGTSLTDNYTLEPKLAEMRAAARLGVPYVFMQESAGPFEKPENRTALGSVMAGAALILLRDPRSLEYVVDIGAPRDRCAVLPDTAFALAPDVQPAPPPESGGPRIVISMRDWKFFDSADAETGMSAYLDSVAGAVTGAVRTLGAEVVFSSTCQGRPEYWTDDSLVADAVVARLPDDVRARVAVDRLARTPRQLMSYLGTFHAMVSTRLHGAILAACAGLPTLPIAYEFKTHEVWKSLDLSDWVLDINSVDEQSLTDRLLALVDDREKVRATLAATIGGQRDGALRAGPMIAAVIGT